MQARKWQYLASVVPDQLVALVKSAWQWWHGPPVLTTGISACLRAQRAVVRG